MRIWIKGITAIPVTERGLVLENTNIYVEDGRFTWIGEERSDFAAEKVIDGTGKLAIPGLINLHTHLGMSLMRNYADDLDLMDWLTKEIWLLEAKLSRDDIYYGSLLSMMEMIRSGTTCFNDMYMEMDRVGDAALKLGMRGVLARGFVEDDQVEEKYESIRRLYKDYHGREGLLQVAVAPHAPYTVGPEHLVRLKELALELGTFLHIHLSETAGEVERAKAAWGKSPIVHCNDLGIFEVPSIGAHCVHVDEEDIRILAEKGVTVAHNPASNLKLASGFAPVTQMMEAGVQVALGTDGASSNNRQNMIEEMHLASILAKAVSLNPKALGAYEALEMATIKGAQAIGLGDELGKLEKGYLADITIMDLSGLHHSPMNDIISDLAYSSAGSDVDTVIIQGKIVLDQGYFLGVDEEQVKGEVNRRIQRLKDER